MVLVEPEIILMRRKNICWRGSVTRWRNGMNGGAGPATRNVAANRATGDQYAQAIRDVLLNSSEQALADQKITS